MSKSQLEKLLHKELTRKEFLILSGAIAAAAIGIVGVMKELLSQAATPTASIEPESASVTTPAAIISDPTASNSKAVQFKEAAQSNNTFLGMYNGNPNEAPDEKFVSLFASAPDIATTYITGQAVNETYEKKRLAAGTSIVFDLDPKNTPGLLYEVSVQSATGLAYVNTFLQAVQRVAASSSNNAKVYVAFAHEWEVKRAQGRWTDARDASALNYAKAHSVFNERARAIAPDVIPGFWTGGHANNHAILAQVMAAMTESCKWVSIDPYRTSGSETLAQNWNRYGLDFFKADPTYQSWGRPPLFVTEFGINTDNITDATAAAFLTGIRDTMRATGVSGAVYFNRDRSDEAANHMWKLDNGDTPQALAAFRASFNAT